MWGSLYEKVAIWLKFLKEILGKTVTKLKDGV